MPISSKVYEELFLISLGSLTAQGKNFGRELLAEDTYNQDKASKIQTCTVSGGTAIIGGRVWAPSQGHCNNHPAGFFNRTVAYVTCCASPTTSPSPSPEEAVLCDVAFGPGYYEYSTIDVAGVGTDVGCTTAKTKSQTTYDTNLATAKAQCPQKVIEYGNYDQSRCSLMSGIHVHLRYAKAKCCVNGTLASLSPSPTSYPIASSTPSPTATPTP